MYKQVYALFNTGFIIDKKYQLKYFKTLKDNKLKEKKII